MDTLLNHPDGTQHRVFDVVSDNDWREVLTWVDDMRAQGGHIEAGPFPWKDGKLVVLYLLPPAVHDRDPEPGKWRRPPTRLDNTIDYDAINEYVECH